MGEPSNPHFYEFGILGHVQTPKKLIKFIFGGTRIPKQNQVHQESHWNLFENINGILNFDIFGKDRRRQIMKIRLIKC